MVLPLDAFTTAAVQAGAGALDELTLVESEIEQLISGINHEIQLLDVSAFEREGEIPAGSFGGSDRAPTLAMHYGGAQRATYQRLVQTREDLVAFSLACAQARNLILDADRANADALTTTRHAVDALSVGATPFGDRGDR